MRMYIRLIVRNIFSWLLYICVIILFFVPMIIFMCIPFSYRFASRSIFWFINVFYVASLKCTLLPITYHGFENIPNEPVIFVVNHQSSLDIPLVGILSKG